MEQYLMHLEEIFIRTCMILRVKGFKMKIMNRQGPVKNLNGLTLGYIKLSEKLIVLDVLTPKRRQPRSVNSILRLLAHELAHYQRPPYRQRYKGRWIIRQHYPRFYKQVNKNIEKLKNDDYFKQYFRNE
ncbi:MAG: hypothetical protein ACOZBH_05355 [Patescibacteria group bacterium]